MDSIQEVEDIINKLKTYNIEVPLDLIKKLEQLKLEAEKTQTPMYDTLVANAVFPLTQEKKDCIAETIDAFLDPNLSDIEQLSPGLLLGNIQCGKTDTFENIIALGFDKGFDICVVFTKNNTALATQTKRRFLKDYAYFAPNCHNRVTVNIYDIMDIKETGLNEAIVNSTKIVIVCKKETQNITHLINLFDKKNDFLPAKKLLIVDDEADFASRNYKKTKGGGKTQLGALKTSELIDGFRKLIAFHRYLQVTATPYSLLLQPDGELNLLNGKLEPFKPRFVSIVPVHDKYIGARQYFVESQDPDSLYSYLHNGVSPNGMKVMYKRYAPYLTPAGHESKNLAEIERAICGYFMSTAVRRIQSRKANPNINYHSSAVFHIEISKDKHDWQWDVIESIVSDMRDQLLNKNISTWLTQCMGISYHYLFQSHEAAFKAGLITDEFPSHEEITNEMYDILVKNNYEIRKINSDNAILALLDANTGELTLTAAANIFVGGNILDRGITIQHLLCFFYGRNPSTFQQDTVLQHARMFGARSLEDMSVTRFHTTPRIYMAFQKMCEMDEELRQRIISSKKTGEDIGPIFVGFNKDIKPCAPSKIMASEMCSIKPHQRILPVGFMAGYKTHIEKTIKEIDAILTSPSIITDRNGFFAMDKSTVVDILKKIEKTYIYSQYYENEDFKNDMTEMLCALEYSLSQARNRDVVYCWNVTNRDLNRKRTNGTFNNSPEGGSDYIDMMKNKAVDQPVIAFIKESGKRNVVNGENIGWNDAPFYWPVLLTQKDIKLAVYTTNNK